MKILGIVGSMRKTGNTNLLIETVLNSAKKRNPQVETKILQISELKIESCRACYDLCSKEPYKCVIEDDLQAVFEEMKHSQGIVIGSPLYFRIPSRLTAFMERLVSLAHFHFYAMRALKEQEPLKPLNNKPCGFVAVCGDDNPRPVLEHLFHFALYLKMKPITMKSGPYFGVGGSGKLEEGKDWNSIENAKTLGELLVKAMEERLRSHHVT